MVEVGGQRGQPCLRRRLRSPSGGTVSGVRGPRTSFLVSLTAGLALLSAASSRAALPTLYFHYAADCTFQLVDDSGNQVTTIPPGSYQVVIDTPFSFATSPASCPFVKFDLTGPGVSVQTTLGDGGSEIEQYPVTLKPSSTYARPGRRRAGADAQDVLDRRRRLARSGHDDLRRLDHDDHVGQLEDAGNRPEGPPTVVQRGALVGTVRTNGTLSLTQDRLHPAGRPQQPDHADRGPFRRHEVEGAHARPRAVAPLRQLRGQEDLLPRYGLDGTVAGDRPTVRRRRSSTIATPEIASRRAAQPPT